ncbi:MAG: type II toxin-antitoxin system RelE family toxin [Limisphaerales bacterium]
MKATQVYFPAFDSAFFRLSADLQRRIESKIDEIGLRISNFPHYRMSGSDRYRFRVGDYRVIYRMDASKEEIYLLAVGHRREIYR